MPGGTLKLHYFESRGRAEPIRLVFAASNIPFVDMRYTQERWPKQKTLTPTGVLPYVEAPGQRCSLVQSGAIARYFARKAGLMGTNDWEYYLVERALGQIDDLFLAFFRIVFAAEDQKAALRKEFHGEKGQNLMACLVRFLKEGGVAGSPKFYVGSSITLADLSSICLVDTLAQKEPELLAKFPELVEHKARVLAANARVAEWVLMRPESTF